MCQNHAELIQKSRHRYERPLFTLAATLTLGVWLILFALSFAKADTVAFLQQNIIAEYRADHPETAELDDAAVLQKVPADDRELLDMVDRLNPLLVALIPLSFLLMIAYTIGKIYGYSDILERALANDDRDALRFILDHELGHIRLKHVMWWYNLLTFIGNIPGLNYLIGEPLSRAREYGCDKLGHALAADRDCKGLLMLAARRQTPLPPNKHRRLRKRTHPRQPILGERAQLLHRPPGHQLAHRRHPPEPPRRPVLGEKSQITHQKPAQTTVTVSMRAELNALRRCKTGQDRPHRQVLPRITPDSS